MLRLILFLIFGVIFTSITEANTLYQVDLIVFTHQPISIQQRDNTSFYSPDFKHAIALQEPNGEKSPYHLLPTSSSQLQNEYWTLKNKPEYKLLGHYSWVQPIPNAQAIAIPVIKSAASTVHGTLRIQQSGFWFLESQFLFSEPNNQQVQFTFSQKQRLKPDVVYYLDHPQAGMLLKVHKITM